MLGKKKLSEKDIKKAYEHHEMMDELIDEEEDKLEGKKYENEEKMRKLKAFGMAYRKMQGYKMMKGINSKK